MTNSSQAAAPRLVAVTDAASRDPARLLPGMINVDDTDTPGDMVDALALAPFVSGSQAHASTARLDEVRPGVSLLPPGATVLRSAAEPARDTVLAAGDGWTIRIARWNNGGADVSVTATSEDLAASVLKLATKDAAVEHHAGDDVVSMGFWHRSPRRGPYRAGRRVSTEPWESIKGNYAAATASALAELMAVTAGRVDGRHSPKPGRPARADRPRGQGSRVCCTGRPAPARLACCARLPVSGDPGARRTACSTRRSCSTTRDT